MGKKGNPRNLFTRKEMEVLRRARNGGKLVSFHRGSPVILDLPNLRRPGILRGNHHDRLKQMIAETDELPVGSILNPVKDLLSMVGSLEMYAAHYAESLSLIDRRREDCTHALDTQFGPGNDALMLTDADILTVGKKLQRIGFERRSIKNRFETLKLIRRLFESNEGVAALVFLEFVVASVADLQAEQRKRIYAPRTDEMDDLMGMTSEDSQNGQMGGYHVDRP